MLSPFQERVAEIIAGLHEAEGFALAGGAALIARGDVQREARDLDFFGLTPAGGRPAGPGRLPTLTPDPRPPGVLIEVPQVRAWAVRGLVSVARESVDVEEGRGCWNRRIWWRSWRAHEELVGERDRAPDRRGVQDDPYLAGGRRAALGMQ
jgi:hypothetical protein